MLWIVQSNLYNEYGYENFLLALEQFNIDYIVVKPIPFTNQFVSAEFDSMVDDFELADEPFVDTSKPIIVCGSVTLTRIAKDRGWTPGTFMNDNFSFIHWRDGFGSKHILNADAIICKVKDATFDIGDNIFVRPTDDTKSFPGVVMTRDAFSDWQNSISNIESEDEFLLLHKDTEIIVSTAKNIMAEYRFFIVNGEVVTGSLYKQGDRVIHDNVIDERILNFTKNMIKIWQPAEAFVLDIADTENGLKIIEINNLNSAGFYACDVKKIIHAVENMVSTS